jgi:hypothetical protein
VAHQRGSTVSLKLGFEGTFGGGALEGFTLPINSFGVKGSRALNAPATLTGTRNPVVPFAGNLAVAGNIMVPVDSAAMAYWLIAMFGEPVTTGAGPYVHTFQVPASQPSFELETAFTALATAKYQQFVGCKVNSFALTVGGDGELVATIGVQGKSDTLAASTFDASATSVSLARLNNFQAAITKNGVALADVTEFSINLSFPMDGYYTIGSSGQIGSLAEGIVQPAGNIKLLFKDTTLLDEALAGTETGMKLTITGSTSSILEFEFQELLWERNSVDVPGPQGLLVDLNFRPYYDNAGGGGLPSAIVARLTNGSSGYTTGVLPSASISPSPSTSVSPSTSRSPSSSASPSA